MPLPETFTYTEQTQIIDYGCCAHFPWEYLEDLPADVVDALKTAEDKLQQQQLVLSQPQEEDETAAQVMHRFSFVPVSVLSDNKKKLGLPDMFSFKKKKSPPPTKKKNSYWDPLGLLCDE